MQATLRLAVFDFDGVINQTDEPWFRSWRGFIRKIGHDITPREWVKAMERTEDNPVHIVFERTGHYVSHEEFETVCAETLPHLSPENVDQEVLRLMRELRSSGVIVVVVSNADRQWLDTYLLPEHRIHIDHVRECQSRDERKPSPSMLREIMEMYGVKPSECVAFDDMPHGLEAVLSSGMHAMRYVTPLTLGVPMQEVPSIDSFSGLTPRRLAQRFGLVLPSPASKNLGQTDLQTDLRARSPAGRFAGTLNPTTQAETEGRGQ